MKVKITYQSHEEQRAKEIAQWIKSKCEPESVVKVTKSDRYKPFFHLYLTITNLMKPHK